jgi:peptidoglycan/xylan/chitin deacetylase (PgdA/CDA1 family)
VAVLAAPLLVCAVGLGFLQWLPAFQGAGGLHRVESDSPIMARPVVPTLPTPSAREVVPPGRTQVRVPILEYHYIRVNPDKRDRLGFNLSVTPDDFTAQMDWLKASGFHPVDLNEVRAYLHDRQPLPPRPVVLTFDDGYRDFYSTAFPILQAHGFKAVSYVVPGFLDRPNYMSRGDVVTIDRGGMEIAAHTMNHVDLTKANGAQLVQQVDGSRSALEQLVGHPVLDFCYPSGRFNPSVVAQVRAAGFRDGTTTVGGAYESVATAYIWPRVRIDGRDTLAPFTAKLASGITGYQQFGAKPPPGLVPPGYPPASPFVSPSSSPTPAERQH